MKNLSKILFLIAIIIGISALNVSAQTRAKKTSSAKAYYGSSPKKPRYKATKKHKTHKFTRTKPAKGTRADGRTAAYRRRSSRS